MKKVYKKKQKGIAERKTESVKKHDIPWKAVGMGVLLWLFVTWLFFGHGIYRQVDLSPGQIAASTVVAAVDFECENLKETAFMRDKAAAAVPPVFNLNPVPEQRASRLINTIFTRLTELASAPSTNQNQMIVNTMNDLLAGSSVSIQELAAGFPTNDIPEVKGALLKSISEVMQRGILSEEYRITWFRKAPDRQLTIVNKVRENESIRTINYREAYSVRKAMDEVNKQIRKKEQQELIARLLPQLVTDNLVYDEIATDNLRKLAAEAVAPVIQSYPEGITLIRAGDAADQQTVLLMQLHQQKRIEKQDMREQLLEIIGNGLLLLAGLIATAVILQVVAPMLIRQPDKLLLMIILSLATLGIGRLMVFLSAFSPLLSDSMLIYLVPYALAVLLASILLGGSAAICLGFWTSFAMAVLFDKSFNVFVLGMLITITAASTARNVHRRSSLFRAGLWVCAVKLLYVLVVAILGRMVGSTLFGQITAAVLTGILSTVLTLLLIPVFEKLFKITTDITLLELSDMGHPLLQKMAMQAPGTYHHSLMVATLAQNAAEAIGANSLLVRVCAYYHDIGKMAKPEFFTENIQHKENPHDELSPHMSALVITSHVKEGLTLAKRHKLPQPILDAIEQHHGNGLISYFYHKAKTQQPDGTTMADMINDSDFRYGGAPAVTPEMAILSLADASEAASRSIEKPTPQKISNMMDDIFAAKIRDGQMDYANLTMAEIKVVKQSFIFSLSNMLHGRIPYPKDDDNKRTQPTEKPSASAAKTSKAG